MINVTTCMHGTKKYLERKKNKQEIKKERKMSKGKKKNEFIYDKVWLHIYNASNSKSE